MTGTVWLDLESFQVNQPLRGVLFACELKKIKSLIGDNIIVQTTIKAWQDIRKLEGLEGQLSSFSLVWGNIDFSPGTTDKGFEMWDSKGIVTIGHLYEKKTLLSFDHICKRYNIPRTEFFRYLQIQSFLNNRKDGGVSYQPSPLERLVSTRRKKGILGLRYKALSKYEKGKPAFMASNWNGDLNIDIDDATWLQICKLANNISVCNRLKENQFRFLHCLQITPQLRHRMDHNKSELCTKCNVEIRTFIHCVWTCTFIDEYWKNIADRLNLILNIRLNKDPLCLLFGLPDTQLKNPHSKRLLCILTFYGANFVSK